MQRQAQNKCIHCNISDYLHMECRASFNLAPLRAPLKPCPSCSRTRDCLYDSGNPILENRIRGQPWASQTRITLFIMENWAIFTGNVRPFLALPLKTTTQTLFVMWWGRLMIKWLPQLSCLGKLENYPTPDPAESGRTLLTDAPFLNLSLQRYNQ